MSPDHDLLLALLALRLGFIDESRLIEAVQEWAKDPEVALDRILCWRGLTPEEHKVVTEAARLHVARAEGDVVHALHVLGIDRSLQEALLRLRPPDPLGSRIARIRTDSSARTTIVAPPWSGRYELGPELGRGGLARVLEARDRTLDREVAVKVAAEGLPSSSLERFAREARLTARLDHPSVVPVYDFGEAPGTGDSRRLFITMKRIRGRDLKEILKSVLRGDGEARSKYTRRRLLAVFQDVCLGMAYVHAKGVIHRDLKPANIMVGDYGEVYIVDWGLAKEIGAASVGDAARDPAARVLPAAPGAVATSEEETVELDAASMRGGSVSYASELTRAGDVLGTPAYMAPEQALGQPDAVDQRADVFALGAMLFQMLTLEPPRKGSTASELIGREMLANVPKPSLSRTALEPIPPELDAIVLRAMAFELGDRYQTALALHHDVQLFVDGVTDRERSGREAAQRVAAGQRLLDRFRTSREEIRAFQAEAKRSLAAIRRTATPAEKKPLWDLEERIRAMRDERVKWSTEADAEFGQALVADAACAAAADGRCDVAMERFMDAEEAGDRQGMLQAREFLVAHDRRGWHLARLDAPGVLAVRAFVRECGCARPRGRGEVNVEFTSAAPIPWRDGGPVPGGVLEDRDRPVPGVTRREGLRLGHSPACARRELAGVEVRVARYVERERRMVAVEERSAGETPLGGLELPQGSWRVRLVPKAGDLAEVAFPVAIRRGGSWAQDVTLVPREEIPEGFRQVPAGPFTSGGLKQGGMPEELRLARDFFIATFPVTSEEYVEFLEDLVSSGRVDEALKRQPREADRRLWVADAGKGKVHFTLPEREPKSGARWDPRWPAMAVDWHDAMAYCAWRSRRDGRLYTLPHEDEFEKAARGVDGRVYPWGNEIDASFCHTNFSLEGGMSPLPVGSFPMDESPYGVRDLGGGVATWCLGAAEVPYRKFRQMRGGTWANAFSTSQAAYRQGSDPEYLNMRVGLRLVWRPEDCWGQS